MQQGSAVAAQTHPVAQQEAFLTDRPTRAYCGFHTVWNKRDITTNRDHTGEERGAWAYLDGLQFVHSPLQGGHQHSALPARHGRAKGRSADACRRDLLQCCCGCKRHGGHSPWRLGHRLTTLRLLLLLLLLLLLPSAGLHAPSPPHDCI